MKGESPPSTAVPIQVVTPRRECGPSGHRQVGSTSRMQIIPLTNWSSSDFVLPNGWRIEEKHSRGGIYSGMVDKYCFEPQMGKKFRPMAEVKRHQMDEKKDFTTKVSKEAGDKSNMQITPFTNRSTPGFLLPDGWRIEKRQRRSGIVDKYYIEPKTGKKLRSLAEVKRYIMDGKTDICTPKVSKEAEDKNDMQIISMSPSDFVLPDGWRVEGKRRQGGTNPGKVDKYYIEPGTGKRFSSAKAVKRHLSLSDGSTDTSRPKALKQGSDRRVMQINPLTTEKTSNLVLPDGWIIENKKQSHDFTSDKCYVEQATGQRFHSLLAVDKYLKEKEENEYAKPLKEFKRPNRHHPSRGPGSKSKSVAGNKRSVKVASPCPTKSEVATVPKEVTPGGDAVSSEHWDTPEKSNSGEKTEASMDDFACPRATINWVLAGPGGEMWSPFVGDFMVPDSIKQKWSETFISSLHDN